MSNPKLKWKEGVLASLRGKGLTSPTAVELLIPTTGAVSASLRHVRAVDDAENDTTVLFSNTTSRDTGESSVSSLFVGVGDRRGGRTLAGSAFGSFPWRWHSTPSPGVRKPTDLTPLSPHIPGCYSSDGVSARRGEEDGTEARWGASRCLSSKATLCKHETGLCCQAGKAQRKERAKAQPTRTSLFSISF